MKEQGYTGLIGQIWGDMTRVVEYPQKNSSADEERKTRSQELFRQTSRILRNCGEVNRWSGMEGAKNYLKTPPVTLNIEGGKKAVLVLSEEANVTTIDQTYLGCATARDWVRLEVKVYEQFSQCGEILINRNGRLFYQGQPASVEQMDMIGGILSLMENSLPKIDRQRNSA